MSAPVTEIVDFTLPPPPSLDRRTALALLAAAKATLLAQPGCLGARFSTHHEVGTKDDEDGTAAVRATLFIDWDAVSSHHAFTANAAVFGPMKASLAPLAPARPYHAALDPATPTGQQQLLDAAPVVEVLHLYFPVLDAGAGLERDQTALATLREFADITAREAADGGAMVVGTPALGWVVETLEWKGGEKARVAVLMVGWRSVEAHMAYRETEAFKGSIGMVRGLEGLLGMKMYHVSCGEA